MIERLSEGVVNRIAAGEVVQRPSSAVKEMLENSFDAGASSIVVKVRGGGLKLLVVQDNGCGICKGDLKIACERFTTSKLKKFEDLEEIGTYGFRGEALSSISNVANVSIVSKTKDSQCGFSAQYADGKLLAPEPGIQPCAAVNGTTIRVENMFENVPARKRALKNTSEEYTRILEVVCQYAIHRGLADKNCTNGVGVICKKDVPNVRNDLHTTAKSTKLQNIRSVYGHHVANELIPVELQAKTEATETDESFAWSFDGYVANANYSRKHGLYILFINDRLVSIPTLKRALDALYAEFLPKGQHTFVYLSIRMPSRNVDVNVHPTKREVHFLSEEEIVNRIVSRAREKLSGANSSRVFFTQTKLRAPSDLEKEKVQKEETTVKKGKRNLDTSAGSSGAVTEEATSKPVKKKKAYRPSRLVRTDYKVGRLDSFVTRVNKSSSSSSGSTTTTTTTQKPKAVTVEDMDFVNDPSEEAGQLKSVLSLIREFELDTNAEMKDRISSFVLVGWVNDQFCLVQSKLNLYYMDYVELSREMFYQQVLLRFGTFGRIFLPDKPRVDELIRKALEHAVRVGQREPVPDMEALVKEYSEKLCSHSGLLDEYFRICIHPETKVLTSLPQIIPDYTPSNAAALAVFLLKICEQVEWDDETECFEGIAIELSLFYSFFVPFSVEQMKTLNDTDAWLHKKTDRRHIVKNIVFPQLRTSLCPSERHADPSSGVFIQLASIHELYKVFERC